MKKVYLASVIGLLIILGTVGFSYIEGVSDNQLTGGASWENYLSRKGPVSLSNTNSERCSIGQFSDWACTYNFVVLWNAGTKRCVTDDFGQEFCNKPCQNVFGKEVCIDYDYPLPVTLTVGGRGYPVKQNEFISASGLTILPVGYDRYSLWDDESYRGIEVGVVDLKIAPRGQCMPGQISVNCGKQFISSNIESGSQFRSQRTRISRRGL